MSSPAATRKPKARLHKTRAGKGPVSVPFPADLRRRTEAFARHHNLQLATAVRLLVTERMEELDDASSLSRAEEWQRAAAWATWEQIAAGRQSPVPRARLESIFARARRARDRTSKTR